MNPTIYMLKGAPMSGFSNEVTQLLRGGVCWDLNPGLLCLLLVTGLHFCVSKQALTHALSMSLTENERVANCPSAYSCFVFTYKALFKRNIQNFYGILFRYNTKSFL